ncbi:hypothetical protein [Ureibacillus acetophenoni]|uniref:Uncharacterized protein n=1 Tax=Ureibacillus acetophenoni TaxID=614649 RepID=A0A285UDY8_9BACL|nr:hypothetical protein [Ureibacillus acetophenoni]SOC39887.1 hypothetical protein SAMN05877842_106171 [Ureibacillus acetophenoni]
MSIKDELKKSIPTNLNMTEQEKASIRYRVQKPVPKKRNMQPAFISFLFVVLLGILILPNISIWGHESTTANPTPMSEPEQPLYNLTDEEKLALYEEYVSIVEEANQLKLGLKLEVSPIEEFEDSYWVTVEQFQNRIQGIVDETIENEREAVKDATPNIKYAVTNVNGETTKGTFMVISGLFKEIKVTAKFETEYNAELNRHLFAGIDNVSTELVYKNKGEWEQVSYNGKMVNNGQTYELNIEGIFTYLNISYEKVFTIEFHCDSEGNIQ